MILILIVNVNSLGITPGRTNMDFSPNLERLNADVSFSIVNTEHKDMDVGLTVQGELKDYITLGTNIASFSSTEESKFFLYNINLTRTNGLSPGLHKAEIVAIEIPKDVSESGMVLKTTVSVVTQVYIYVLYPGKYLEANLDFMVKEDSLGYFYIPMISRGNETIDNIKATIDIYDSSNKKIKTINSELVDLRASERKEMVGIWKDPVEGRYKSICKIEYDGKIIEIEKDIVVGEDVSLLSVGVNDFKLGGIAKIRILVQNKLDTSVQNTYANLKIFDNGFKQIEDLKSELYEIPSSSNKEMIVYWDTEKIGKGTYDSELKIDFNQKFLSKKMKIDIKEDSMVFSGVGFVVSEGNGKISSMSILYIIIGALALINLSWLVWFIRSRSKKSKNTIKSKKSL